MNKIVVKENKLILENTEILITDFENSNCTFHVYNNVKCGIFSLPKTTDFTIYIHEGAHFTLEFYGNLCNHNCNITIYNEDYSQLDFHISSKFTSDNTIKIENKIKANNTKVNILVRTVEENGTLNILAEGIIAEKTQNNEYLEDIRAITNNNNHIRIMPNLLVKSNSVKANHNATISNIKDEELFYLTGKGISKDSAKELIKTGFLQSILKIEELKMGGEE